MESFKGFKRVSDGNSVKKKRSFKPALAALKSIGLIKGGKDSDDNESFKSEALSENHSLHSSRCETCTLGTDENDDSSSEGSHDSNSELDSVIAEGRK